MYFGAAQWIFTALIASKLHCENNLHLASTGKPYTKKNYERGAVYNAEFCSRLLVVRPTLSDLYKLLHILPSHRNLHLLVHLTHICSSPHTRLSPTPVTCSIQSLNHQAPRHLLLKLRVSAVSRRGKRRTKKRKGKTYRRDVAAMCDFASGVIDEMNLKYTLLSLNLDEEICLITNFGRRGIGKGELGNKGRACLFLLKVSFDKVDSSVDLVFLNLFLHL